MPRLAAVFCAMLLSFTLRGDLKGLGEGAGPFSSDRLKAHWGRIAELGPRPMGSEAGRETASYIAGRLLEIGLAVRVQEFSAAPPTLFQNFNSDLEKSRIRSENGRILGRNVWAAVPARAGERPACAVLVVTHYDSKNLPGFIGAVDGGSGTILLIELAAALALQPPRHLSVIPVFMDGEEAYSRVWAPFGRTVIVPDPSGTPRAITVQDALYGSRHFAEHLDELSVDGVRFAPRVVLDLDMVGDGDLRLTDDAGTTPRLRGVIQEEIARLERKYAIPLRDMETRIVEDDHTPFHRLHRRFGGPVQEIGIIIDLDYPYWHTDRDRRIDVRETAVAGELVLNVISRIDADSDPYCGRVP